MSVVVAEGEVLAIEAEEDKARMKSTIRLTPNRMTTRRKFGCFGGSCSISI